MAAPVAGLGRIPPGVSWPVAAVTCCTTGTAVHCLRTRGRLMAGETVLVTGASGGVGMQAVQLARLDGGRGIAVTSSAGKAAVLGEAGAAEVIVSPRPAFAPQVRPRPPRQGPHPAPH